MGFALALSAGMVTAFNPCGVALLPAFLSLLLAQRGQAPARAWTGVRAGFSMTVGFVVIFGLAGLVVSSLGRTLFVLAPITSVVVALGLVGLAWRLWRGASVPVPGLASWEHGVLAWLNPRGRGSFVVYGLSYGLVSLTCSLPVFMAVAATGFHQSLGVGLLRYGIYAAGMGLIVTALAVLTVTARRIAEATIHSVVPVIPKISAVVMTLGSVYLLWYWLGGPGRHTGLL